jgi:hypothetical protein
MAGASTAATPAGWWCREFNQPDAAARRTQRPAHHRHGPCRRSSRRNWTPASGVRIGARRGDPHGPENRRNPRHGQPPALRPEPQEDVATNGFNYAIQAIYEPGSTFKIIATAGRHQRGLGHAHDLDFCHNGVYQEGKIRVPDHHPYGNLTLEGVLAKSSNIGTYKFARQLGTKRFFEYTDAGASAARPASCSAAKARASRATPTTPWISRARVMAMRSMSRRCRWPAPTR